MAVAGRDKLKRPMADKGDSESMIDRLYIDNFKCFTSFEFQPESIQLVLGDNGSGKTSAFDVLETLREFVTTGADSTAVFPTETLTAWDARNAQTFELDVTGNGGTYQYRLVVEHDRKGRRSRIRSEQLYFDDQILYEFDGSDAHLFRDDPAADAGPVFPFDWSRSAIPTIPERGDNTKLTWFRERMRRIFIFSPDPIRMEGESSREMPTPDRRLHYLGAWLRHLSQESVDALPNLRDALKDVMPGLETFKLEKTSEHSRSLVFQFEFDGGNGAGKNGSPFQLPFGALSDGQRSLVALFTIVNAVVTPDSSILIDEPDNYVALREIQPWLTALEDRAEDCGSQVVLISHHPELINYLAANHGLLFFRDGAGPVRTRPFVWKDVEFTTPAETVARGWE